MNSPTRNHDIKVHATIYWKFNFRDSSPTQQKYVFDYFVTIHNQQEQLIQILFRHWQIWNAMGEETYIAGPGIKETTPTIEPQSSFHYQSQFPMNTMAGFIKGRFDIIQADGEQFSIQTPRCSFFVPEEILD